MPRPANNQQASLLGIPAELRIMIYEHLSLFPALYVVLVDTRHHAIVPAIARTCRVLRKESLPLFFANDYGLFLDHPGNQWTSVQWLKHNFGSEGSQSAKRMLFQCRRPWHGSVHTGDVVDLFIDWENYRDPVHVRLSGGDGEEDLQEWISGTKVEEISATLNRVKQSGKDGEIQYRLNCVAGNPASALLALLDQVSR